MPVFLLVVMAAWWFAVRPIMHEEGWVKVSEQVSLCGDATRTSLCVIDGDTVHMGDSDTRRRIRLTGFDAPELDGACDGESRLAINARDALREWLARGEFEWNGADDPPRDKYGRELRAARRVGSADSREYLADVMIERGLAAKSSWGSEPRNWCAP